MFNHPNQSTTVLTASKYPALLAIQEILKNASWVILSIGVLLFFVLGTQLKFLGGAAWGLGLFFLVLCGAVALFLRFFAESIEVMIDIEANTRAVLGVSSLHVAQSNSSDLSESTSNEPVVKSEIPMSITIPDSMVIKQDSRKLFCGKCGKGMVKGQLFCTDCGERLLSHT
jgi:hypothetical protein